VAEEWALSDAGLQNELDAWRAGIASVSNYSYGLFKSDTHPAVGDVIGNYTESDFTGYARQTLANSAYQAASVTSNVAESLANAPVNFDVSSSFVGSQLCYGYLVFNSGGTFLWAVRFANVRTLYAYDRLSVTPKMRMKNTT